VLQGAGIAIFETDTMITDAVTDIYSGGKPRATLPARDCATSCEGPGTGCG